MGNSEPVAETRLIYRREGVSSLVTARVFAPIPFEDPSDGIHPHYCILEVLGLMGVDAPQDKQFKIVGATSLQCLTLALRKLWLILRPFEKALALPGGGALGYHGIPFQLDLTSDFDADFRDRLIENIESEVEIYLRAHNPS